MALTGNKGEWSEIYVLLKLLGDTKVFAGSADLKRINDLYYPIVKILRKESNAEYQYEVNEKAELIMINRNGINIENIPISIFKNQSKYLLSHIKSAVGSSFSIPLTEDFMHSIFCISLKAKSSDKSDIHIVIHDLRTKTTPLLGFSIKSMLGNPSTLLNSGRPTNFIYKIEGSSITNKDIEAINNIETHSKILDRIKAITKKNGKLVFHSMESPIFKNNLILIDSLLPNIVAEILKSHYCDNLSSIKEIVNKIQQENPLHFDNTNSHHFYEYKVKRLLIDSALGMTSAKVWNGKYDATGGYLIVKEDGDVVCYHIYNKNDFEDYLFENTRIETPSSERYDFGKIEQKNTSLFFKLNLQIRFIR